jgi:hypothetical protein
MEKISIRHSNNSNGRLWSAWAGKTSAFSLCTFPFLSYINPGYYEGQLMKERFKFSVRGYCICAGSAVLLSLYLAFLSCSNPIEPARKVSSEQEVIWPVSPAQSYIIDQRRECFCPGPYGFVRLTVIDNRIVEGVNLESDSSLTEEELQGYMTIDELFELVEKAKQGPAAELRVKYDSTFGYPCKVSIDWNSEVMDEEIAFETRLVYLFP